MSTLDSYTINRCAWNALVAAGNEWTQPVGPEVIAQARHGTWEVRLTPTRKVPRSWFGELRGRDVLGLASAGGQQCPVFAAAGARVTSFDASEAQLAQDRLVATREGLDLTMVQGNMQDLGGFADASFDLVFNPCSTAFVDDVRPVWREVARVLRPGGVLLTGFTNPWFYLFDAAALERGACEVVRGLPAQVEDGGLIEFSHSFEAQLGGQLEAGLLLTAMYEDTWDALPAMHALAPAFMATRAIKPTSL